MQILHKVSFLIYGIKQDEHGRIKLTLVGPSIWLSTAFFQTRTA